MNEQDLQVDNSQQMPPEDIRAALGFSTNLMSQMMPVDAQEAPQDAQNAPQQENGGDVEEDKETEKEDKVGELKAEMEGFKVEVKTLIEQQIDGLRKDIKDALSNEQENGEN